LVHLSSYLCVFLWNKSKTKIIGFICNYSKKFKNLILRNKMRSDTYKLCIFYGILPEFNDFFYYGYIFLSSSVIPPRVFIYVSIWNALTFPKEKGSNILFYNFSFFFIVWHRRLKNQKHSKQGLRGLISEDKELAELQGLAAGVGLANACYAIQYVA
jgi:hypothetical protein